MKEQKKLQLFGYQCRDDGVLVMCGIKWSEVMKSLGLCRHLNLTVIV